jgi:hypothetical protein
MVKDGVVEAMDEPELDKITEVEVEVEGAKVDTVKDGEAEVDLGTAEVDLGNVEVLLGVPEVVLGVPEVVLGVPEVVLGVPEVVLGVPEVVLGIAEVLFDTTIDELGASEEDGVASVELPICTELEVVDTGKVVADWVDSMTEVPVTTMPSIVDVYVEVYTIVVAGIMVLTTSETM